MYEADEPRKVLSLAAEIVASFVGDNPIAADETPAARPIGRRKLRGPVRLRVATV